MQGATPRLLILAAVLGCGVALTASVGSGPLAAGARWPSEDSLYAMEGWAMSAAAVDAANGAHFVSRNYLAPDGSVVGLVVSTSTAAKTIYRAGADVPFLGSGYSVDPAPPSLAPASRSALVARKENEAYLLLYAYGERRGLLGSGLTAWSAAALDAVLGMNNDYYRATIVAPLTGHDSNAAHHAVALADTMFPRLAAWYGA